MFRFLTEVFPFKADNIRILANKYRDVNRQNAFLETINKLFPGSVAETPIPLDPIFDELVTEGKILSLDRFMSSKAVPYLIKLMVELFPFTEVSLSNNLQVFGQPNFSGDLTSLFHNDDGKFFTDVSRESGLKARQYLGWGVAFVDVDDDGWRDLIVANGHVYPEVEGKDLGDTYLQSTVLYRNLGNGKFKDVTNDSGPAFATPRAARGLAVGDLYGDGRQEIVIVNMNGVPSLLKNSGTHWHFLNLILTGTKSNRSAIGARAIVSAGGHKMIDEVMSGSSYYSSNSFTLHFGLGTAVAGSGWH